MKKNQFFNAQRRRDTISGYLFLMPAILSFLIFIAIPIIMAFVLTTYKYNLIQPPQFVGLQNIKRLLSDPMVRISLLNTLKFLIILVPIHCAGGLVLAYLVSQVKNSGLRTAYRSAIYFPSIVTTASVTIVWAYMFATDTGFINYFLRQFGFANVPWMTSPNMVYTTIALFSFWKFIGTAFLYYFIGLQNIPAVFYDAAKIDGANSVQTFFKITLPLLSPTIFFVMVTNIIGVFQIFDEPFLLTGGGPGTLTKSFALYIYEVAFKQMNTGYGSVLSVIIFLIILVVTVLQFIGQRKWVVYDYE